MAGIRLYILGDGSPCNVAGDNVSGNSNGCIQTGLFDPARFPSGCGDPRAFRDLATLFDYCNTHGERARQVASAAEAASICSNALQATAPGPNGSAVITGGGGSDAGACMSGGPCGPSSPAPPGAYAASPANPPASTSGSPAGGLPVLTGGATSGPAGSLPGTGVVPTSTAVVAKGAGVPSTTDFDFVGFIKSPLGYLLLFLLIVILIVTHRGG